MCRNIKSLFNFDPPVSEDEIHAAAIQYVRKISGFNKPSKANETAYLDAVEAIEAASSTLLKNLKTNAPPRSRDEEIARAKAKTDQRFSK